MNKSNSTWLFLFGLWLGYMITVVVVANTDNVTSRAKAAIAECEKHLPRDENCRIIALPVSRD